MLLYWGASPLSWKDVLPRVWILMVKQFCGLGVWIALHGLHKLLWGPSDMNLDNAHLKDFYWFSRLPAVNKAASLPGCWQVASSQTWNQHSSGLCRKHKIRFLFIFHKLCNSPHRKHLVMISSLCISSLPWPLKIRLFTGAFSHRCSEINIPQSW